MPKPLTQAQVNDAHTSTRALIADGEFKGLYLDVRPNGKSYRYRFTDRSGQARNVTVGDARLIKLQDARKIAKDMGRKALMGEEVWAKPGRVAPTAEEKAKPAMTLRDFIHTRYMPYAKATKRSFLTEWSILKTHILPELGDRPFVGITKPELIQYLHGKLQYLKPGTVNRILNGLKVIYSRALEWEVEGLVKSPLQGIKQFPNLSRHEKFLTQEEAAHLLQAVLQSDNKMLAPIVSALLLTGCRKREILDARWEHVDLAKGILVVPISKSGKPRHVVLSEPVKTIFRQTRAYLATEMGHEAADACPWVFPNPVTGKPFVGIYKSWNAARQSVGLKDLRVHDLRHSFASALVNAGGTLYDAQRLLGHSSSRMTERYAHLTLSRLTNAASDVSNHFNLGQLAIGNGGPA
jgi:integrase